MPNWLWLVTYWRSLLPRDKNLTSEIFEKSNVKPNLGDDDQINTDTGEKSQSNLNKPGSSTVNIHSLNAFSQKQTPQVIQQGNQKSLTSSSTTSNSFQENIKPPDIVIRFGQSWASIQSIFSKNHINFTSAKTTPDGTKVRFPSMNDYRNALAILKNQNIPYHTFMPANERDLHVVIRGAGFDMDCTEVQQDLILQGFSPLKTVRMKHPRSRQDMPMILVTLPRNDAKSKDIFNVVEICRLMITIEPLRQSAEVGQCFRCLLFGHSSARCTAPPRCKNCAEAHDSRLCQLPKNGPLKCANCGGNHRATFRGCDRAPLPRYSQEAPQTTNTRIQETPMPGVSNFPSNFKNNPQSSQRANLPPPRRSMAQVVKGGNRSQNPPQQLITQNPPQLFTQQDMMASVLSFQEAIGTLASMFSNMSQLFNVNKFQ